MKHIFIIYDGRAAGGDTEDASVYESCDTLQEAQKDRKEMFPDGVIYRYDINGKEMTNETFMNN